jgi:hypothetical protein
MSLQILYDPQRVRLVLTGSNVKWIVETRPPSLERKKYYSYYERNEIIAALDRLKKRVKKAPRQMLLAYDRLDSALRLMYRPILKDIQRVASGRSAPRRWYPVADVAGNMEDAGLFDAVHPKTISNAHRSRHRHEHWLYEESHLESRVTYDKRLAAELEKLDIASSIKSIPLSTYHNGVEVTDSKTGIASNLIDVGYGASQVIPVLRACLSDATGPLFVEQPEIHLHPKAQGSLSDLLCETSTQRQVVVETHSVHMINQARIRVAKGDIPPEHVLVIFVEKTKRGSRIHVIPIKRNGDFAADWPGGFFDERYQETMKLLKLKSSVGSLAKSPTD